MHCFLYLKRKRTFMPIVSKAGIPGKYTFYLAGQIQCIESYATEGCTLENH